MRGRGVPEALQRRHEVAAAGALHLHKVHKYKCGAVGGTARLQVGSVELGGLQARRGAAASGALKLP